MLRSSMTGFALFAIGVAAGFLVNQHLTSPTQAQRPDLVKVASSPTNSQPNAKTDNQASRPAPAVLLRPVQVSARPAQDIVIIRHSAPPSPTETERTVPPANSDTLINWKPNRALETAKIRMTEPSYGQSALANNTVVIRELARDIQHELQRVGCRSVVTSGRWDARTIKASARFSANQNALLPMDKPDVVLLSLLRNYKGGRCGQTTAGEQPLGGRPIASAPLASISVQPSRQKVSSQSRVRRNVRRRARIRSSSRRAEKRKAQATSSSKEQTNWRRQVHYGAGSD